MVRTSTLVYMAKKVLTYAIVLFVSFTVVFFVLRLIPGDPVTRFVNTMEQQRRQSQRDLKIIAEWKRKFGLDQDLFTQYVSYVRRVFLEFDFGPSFVTFPTPSSALIMRALPWSIALLGLATIIAWILGLVVGTFIGWRRGGKLDSYVLNLALCMSQIPYYLLALLLLMVLAYSLRWFPTRWAYSPALTPGLNLEFILDVLYHAALPALSLVLTISFGWMISTRAMTITVLGEDYMLFARAKGLKRWRIVNRYALRNILLPQVTGLAMSLGFVVNGFFLIEWFFTYPGMGHLLVYAMRVMDYNTIMGVTITSILTVLGANLIVDVIYPLIDPRITHGES